LFLLSIKILIVIYPPLPSLPTNPSFAPTSSIPSWLPAILLLFFFLLGFAAMIFWLVMLIHAAHKPIENRVMWLILLVLIGPIGALIYYFAVKRKFKNQEMPPPIS